MFGIFLICPRGQAFTKPTRVHAKVSRVEARWLHHVAPVCAFTQKVRIDCPSEWLLCLCVFARSMHQPNQGDKCHADKRPERRRRAFVQNAKSVVVVFETLRPEADCVLLRRSQYFARVRVGELMDALAQWVHVCCTRTKKCLQVGLDQRRAEQSHHIPSIAIRFIFIVAWLNASSMFRCKLKQFATYAASSARVSGVFRLKRCNNSSFGTR